MTANHPNTTQLGVAQGRILLIFESTRWKSKGFKMLYVILVYLHSDDVCIYSATIQISEMDLIDKNFVPAETRRLLLL